MIGLMNSLCGWLLLVSAFAFVFVQIAIGLSRLLKYDWMVQVDQWKCIDQYCHGLWRKEVDPCKAQ